MHNQSIPTTLGPSRHPGAPTFSLWHACKTCEVADFEHQNNLAGSETDRRAAFSSPPHLFALPLKTKRKFTGFFVVV